MSVAETWDLDPPAGVEPAGVHIVIVDGADTDERQLLQAAAAAGIDCAWEHWSGGRAASTALLLEGRDAELLHRCLRELRACPHFERMPALLSVTIDQLEHMETDAGFDDFVLAPCTALEVRMRVRAIAQRRQAVAPASETEQDGIAVDAVSHEALVDGRTVRLTAREFALFAYLRARPGRVLSRQHLLAQVWGHRYRGGPRTVDTHIGRLRLKFGASLPIETVRANGYRLNCASLAAAAE
jgi:DNA-binding response OmpR family regulator